MYRINTCFQITAKMCIVNEWNEKEKDLPYKNYRREIFENFINVNHFANIYIYNCRKITRNAIHASLIINETFSNMKKRVMAPELF